MLTTARRRPQRAFSAAGELRGLAEKAGSEIAEILVPQAFSERFANLATAIA
jgi:hypothetical protein